MKSFTAIVLLLCSAGCARRQPAAPFEALPPRPPEARPAWVKEGIVMAGNWEPLSFIRRRGGQPIQDVENWPLERTEEAARRLGQAGVNLVITNFHKGFGLKTEAEDMAATRRFVEFAHRHGIRVGGYIGAYMMYETFFAEEPEARGWMQVDEWGRPIYYNRDQTFRYMACRNHPGYQRFIKRLLELAVRDYKLDLIHFDQMEFRPEPLSCRCPHCREQFLKFLERRYPPGGRVPRFGFERLDGLAPPPFDLADGPPVRLPYLRNPLMQEWALFRMESIARRYGEYDAFLYSLNPEVALEGNPNVDPATNRAFTHGADIPQMLQHGDIVWSEDPHHAQWTEDGLLISKIRGFKMTRIMGKSAFVYTGGRYGASEEVSPAHLRIAEAMAFNDMNLGMVGDVAPDGVHLTPAARRYIDFFLANRDVLRETTPIPEVAVLRARASMEFMPGSAIPGTVLFEQVLIQHQIPFDIIFDRHLADLSRYRVLVLANQEALSETQLQQIRQFVASGGGLVATGSSSLWTDWLLERTRFGLADLFGLDRPPSATAPNTPLRRQHGSGRVVYIPRIEPAIPPPAPQMTYNFSHDHWRMPKNASDLVAAIEWAGASRPLTAPPHVVVEVARQRTTGRILLHLVNYNTRQSVSNLEVALRLPAGAVVRYAALRSPDLDRPLTLPAAVRNGAVSFRVPLLKTYDLLVLE
jgi:hypothetical protein